MSTDRTVLEHLLEGRDALLAEVRRLNAAIAELDSVIVRIGGTASSAALAPADAPQPAAVEQPTAPAPQAAAAEPSEPSAPPAPRSAPAKKAAARKAPAKKAAARKAPARAAQADGGKSIRVHVLEMLGSENRDFGLAEIIDRVHGLGIQAHDDAVRSITIKLMKDGRVERVGRGQYRLARRGAPAAPVTPPPAPASSGYVPPLDFDAEPGV